ncbi:hypothetical protein EYF80_027503 [Liparis tanakae]|uniref:Uncharacterized protein n=1 Tax=Liparis tanakae TaxID=230148 RepID=A0A4Z2H8T9_9TELE|nr:hypothetical protein EYF80_027503 [Liparis tanakae]
MLQVPVVHGKAGAWEGFEGGWQQQPTRKLSELKLSFTVHEREDCFVVVDWHGAVDDGPSNIKHQWQCLTPIHLSLLAGRTENRFSASPGLFLTGRRMRKYPDQNRLSGQASAANLVLSMCEQVKALGKKA